MPFLSDLASLQMSLNLSYCLEQAYRPGRQGQRPACGGNEHLYNVFVGMYTWVYA